MRCEQGDLAFIIKANHEENLGKVVKVIRRNVGGEKSVSNNGKLTLYSPESCEWIVEGNDILCSNVISTRKDYFNSLWAMDSQLQPIRYNEGEDEIIRIAGYPNQKESV